ncbi:unnamed protein product [Didymodactylos carnosus]|uniref:Uncharacterized protein n=1 Tax=Didymodactylos carnosus TaxID=1234261 RepID=A0A8S2D0F4_9BILA|nr:unnamed protein product [Didymodactylos carnosus]CAF3635357.1 unnamed protein product [Didymodactylos carnosus]
MFKGNFRGRGSIGSNRSFRNNVQQIHTTQRKSWKTSDEYIEEMSTLILNNATTSVLLILENIRSQESLADYKDVLTKLCKKLKDPSFIGIGKLTRKTFGTRRNFLISSFTDINNCCLTIFYYIVSICHKLNIENSEIWLNLLKNKLTQTLPFYRYLSSNNIQIPLTVCTNITSDLSSLCKSWPAKMKVNLIYMGFTDLLTSSDFLHIADWEKLMCRLKMHGQEFYFDNEPSKRLKPTLLYEQIDTPEKLSLFINYFPEYDLNQLTTESETLFDVLIRMRAFFYLNDDKNANVRVHLSRSSRNRHKQDQFGPNETSKYRTLRILKLFNYFVSKDVKVMFEHPLPSFSRNYFLHTTVGLYVLACLRIEDLFCDLSSVEKRMRIEQFIETTISCATCFDPVFQNFLLHHLHSSYKITHNQKFIEKIRSKRNLSLNQMYDKLFHSKLSLKEQCRLVIKDRIKSYPNDVKKLSILPLTLINYCTYDFFDPNYAQIVNDKVTKHGGKVMPKSGTDTEVSNSDNNEMDMYFISDNSGDSDDDQYESMSDSDIY